MNDLMSKVIGFFVDNTPPWNVILFGGPIGLLWAFSCLYVAGYLKRNKGWRTGYTRKVFHFLIFGSVAVIHSAWGTQIVCLFGGTTTLVVFWAVLQGDGNIFYEAMAREKDAPLRTYYIISPYFATLVGGLLSNILFGEFAVFGYLVTGLGDAIGEPVGTKYGKHTYNVPSFRDVKSTRSYEGSTAVFVVCMLAIWVGLMMLHSPVTFPRSFFIIVPMAFICAVAEAVSPHGWDNATMQIVPSLMMSMLGLGNI